VTQENIVVETVEKAQEVTSTLFVDNCAVSDEADIKVIAENKAGVASHVAKLKVIGKSPVHICHFFAYFRCFDAYHIIIIITVSESHNIDWQDIPTRKQNLTQSGHSGSFEVIRCQCKPACM